MPGGRANNGSVKKQLLSKWKMQHIIDPVETVDIGNEC